MAKSLSLSGMMIMSLLALFAITASFTIYTNWVVANDGTIDPQYDFIYDELTDGYNSLVIEADSIGEPEKAKSILDRIGDFATGTINIFVIGLSSIGQFFALIPIFTGLVETITKIFPMFKALLGLLTVIIGFYVAMRFIKSARGTTIEV